MEITLEQIELVKDRTGVSYKEAKEALEFAGGNVVDAIIYIEENIDSKYVSKDRAKLNSALDSIKNIIRKGNISKVRVTKEDEILLNIPVNVGLVGTVIFPWGAIASVLAAGFTKCRIELIKNDGSVVDITGKAQSAFDTVKAQGGVIVDEVVEKGQAAYEFAKDKGQIAYDFAKDKGQTAYDFAKDKAEDIADMFRKEKEEYAGDDLASDDEERYPFADESDCCEAPEAETPCCEATEEETCCGQENAPEENK